jgi:hypothetical protein
MKKLILLTLIGITINALIVGCSDHSAPTAVYKTAVWTSGQPAAADSVQGKLQAEGKRWVKAPGKIKAGDYVQDILDPRLNQPEGRGAIAKVVSVSGGGPGPLVALVQRLWRAVFPTTVSSRGQPQPAALVDFGRGYRTGINLSELSRVNIEKGQAVVFKTGIWTSDQPAAADSVQGKLQADGKKWVRTTGEIKVGTYVQDILDPRSDQPEGRGAIAKVISVSKGDNGQPVAQVDFGRDYRTGINESELSPVSIE